MAGAKGKKIAGPGGAAVKVIVVPKGMWKEARAHWKKNQTGNQKYTVDRAGSAARRRAALAGKPSSSTYDRDEAPPAVFAQGSQDVENIDPSDNRGMGAWLGNQLDGVPDGSVVKIVF